MLTLGLTLPGPALALRNMAADSEGVQAGLEQALRAPAAEPAAGLEGGLAGGEPVWYDRGMDYPVEAIQLYSEDHPRFFYKFPIPGYSHPLFIPLEDFAWDYGFRLLGNDQVSTHLWKIPRASGYIHLSILGNLGDEVYVQVFDAQSGQVSKSTRLLSAGVPSTTIGRYQLRKAARRRPEGTSVEGVEIVYEHATPFFVEWIPDELHLSVAQQSRFGELTETIWRNTGGPQSIPRLMDPERSWRYQESGFVIERHPAVSGSQRGERRWVLQATLAGDRWDPQPLEEVVGRQLAPGKRVQELPIKFLDGTRIVWTSFFHAQEGGVLTLVTHPEPLEGLPHTRRVLIRLLAKLTQLDRQPFYSPSDPLEQLKEAILRNTPAAEAAFEPGQFRRRWEASWALAHLPDEEGIRFLLKRLNRGDELWEPSASLRMMIVSEIVYRHEQGRSPLQDAVRQEVWHAFAGLGTGRSTGFGEQTYPRDPVEFVSYVAVQGMARLTPDKRKRTGDEHPYLQKAVDITMEAQNDDTLPLLVREILEYVYAALDQQRLMGPGRKWPVLPGAPLEDYPSLRAGLEGGDALEALQAYLANPARSRARGVVLIGSGALTGSVEAGIPPLAPLLIEAAPFLREDRFSVVVYTQGDEGLARRLWSMGYMASASIEAVRNWLPDEGVSGFYGTEGDLKDFPKMEGAVTLTTENFRQMFAELLTRLGYPEPQPAEIETFMDALSWRWAA